MGKKPARITKFEQTSIEGKKAAIYIRVSSHEFLISRSAERSQQGDQRKPINTPTPKRKSKDVLVRQSVATQKADAIQYCKKQEPPWDYEIYQDNEISGTLGKKDRPGLYALLNAVNEGKIHTLLVRDVKRLARNSRLLKEIISDDLMPAGVELHGLNDGIRISNPNALFYTSILAEVAELEIDSIRTNSMRNREQAALDGKLAHGSSTYGFRSSGRRQVEQVPEEADVVKKIFQLYAIKEYSCQIIADRLTKDKAPTRKGSGIWTAPRIYSLLHNPRYVGKINYRDRTMLHSEVFHPIIEMKLWNKAQAELKKRSIVGPRTQNSPHLLTGLLKCPYCLERQKKDPSVRPNMFSMYAGNNVRYYDCQARNRNRKGQKKICIGIRVNAKKIETFIESFVGALAADEFFKFISDQPEGKKLVSERIDILKDKIQRFQQKMDRIPKQIANGTISFNMAGKIEKELTSEIRNRSRELERAEQELVEVSKAEQLDALDKLKKWKTLTVKQKKAALKKVVLEMVMCPDRLLITLTARPNQAIVIPYTSYKVRRKKREFPDVTDGLAIEEKGGKLVIRIGAEFVTMDGRKIRMHIDHDMVHKQSPSDKAIWKEMQKHPEQLDDD